MLRDRSLMKETFVVKGQEIKETDVRKMKINFVVKELRF